MSRQGSGDEISYRGAFELLPTAVIGIKASLRSAGRFTAKGTIMNTVAKVTVAKAMPTKTAPQWTGHSPRTAARDGWGWGNAFTYQLSTVF